MALFIYASNEPKFVLARDLGNCRDDLRNSRSVFLIVYASNEPKSVPGNIICLLYVNYAIM